MNEVFYPKLERTVCEMELYFILGIILSELLLNNTDWHSGM